MPNVLLDTAIIGAMILVVGGSPYIRDALTAQLETIGLPYRLLIQPSKTGANLPKSKGVEIAIASYGDERGIRAAMQGVEVIYHLSGYEESGSHANLGDIDVDGVGVITQSAILARVERFFYLSSIGADRASGFYFLKAKGIAEAILRDSGLDYTILRTSQIFGPGDLFTNTLARLINGFGLLTPIPADLSVIMQPLWVGDLVAAMVWAMEMPETHHKLIEIGGPEQISLEQMLLLIAEKLNKKPRFAAYNPHKYTIVTQFLESMIKKFPALVYWTDLIAQSRICAMDSMPRHFGINPSRFHVKLDQVISTKRSTR